LPITNNNAVSNCVASCAGSYPRISGNYCKAKCIDDEYYDSINQCKSDCGDKYIKIDNNNENICVEISDCPGNKFFINDSGKKQCMPESGCQGEYKYFIDGDNQCYKKCPKKDDGKYYFYNENNNKCIPSCIGTGKEFAEDPTSEPKKCLEDNPGKSYYEEDKILRENCELYKEQNSKVCVKQCQDGYKVYDDYCIDACPSEASYFVDTSIQILGQNKNIKKCVSDCKSESPDYNLYYDKCTGSNKFINPSSDYEYQASCASYEKFANYQNVYICKDSCEEYYTIDTNSNKECLSECPREKKIYRR
jgi:hypothetical protein